MSLTDMYKIMEFYMNNSYFFGYKVKYNAKKANIT